MFNIIRIIYLILCLIKLIIIYFWHRIFNLNIDLHEEISASISYSELSFILGAPRSGTTLLIRLLRQCKDIHGTSEMFFFYPNFSEKKDFSSLRNSISILYELNQIPSLKKYRWRYLNTFITKKLDAMQFYGLLNNHHNKKIIDKVPDYSWYPEYFALLKKSKNEIPIIFIYRHPCSVIESLSKKLFKIPLNQRLNWVFKKFIKAYLGNYYQSPNFNLSIENIKTVFDYCVFLWSLANYNIIHYLKTNSNIKYVLVQYEDLLIHPRIYYQQICKLINAEYNEDYLTFKDNRLTLWEKIWKFWNFNISIGDINQYDDKNNKIDSSCATGYKKLSFLWDRFDSQTLEIANELGYTKNSHDPAKLNKIITRIY